MPRRRSRPAIHAAAPARQGAAKKAVFRTATLTSIQRKRRQNAPDPAEKENQARPRSTGRSRRATLRRAPIRNSARRHDPTYPCSSATGRAPYRTPTTNPTRSRTQAMVAAARTSGGWLGQSQPLSRGSTPPGATVAKRP